jgi:hypothetical protein
MLLNVFIMSLVQDVRSIEFWSIDIYVCMYVYIKCDEICGVCVYLSIYNLKTILILLIVGTWISQKVDGLWGTTTMSIICTNPLITTFGMSLTISLVNH